MANYELRTTTKRTKTQKQIEMKKHQGHFFASGNFVAFQQNDDSPNLTFVSGVVAQYLNTKMVVRSKNINYLIRKFFRILSDYSCYPIIDTTFVQRSASKSVNQ